MRTPYDKLFRLDGRVAAVVGSASGIGAAGNAAESVRVDILDRADSKAFIDGVVRDHGSLDVLVVTPA